MPSFTMHWGCSQAALLLCTRYLSGPSEHLLRTPAQNTSDCREPVCKCEFERHKQGLHLPELLPQQGLQAQPSDSLAPDHRVTLKHLDSNLQHTA